MNKMEALQKWWADPEVVIVPAGHTAQIIDWLGHQNPDTWHQVVLAWHYGFSLDALAWILEQDNCDKGTAARVFLVEGVGHWIWDAFGNKESALDEAHLCNIVLRNWSRYKSGELTHEYDVPEHVLKLVEERGHEGRFASSPLEEIFAYEGNRKAVSKYSSEDGKIVVALEFWLKSNGLKLEA